MLINVHSHQAYCYTGGRAFDPHLPTIVLLHGAQNDHSVWALQSRALAHRGYAVLAPDLPGHGRSSGPALDSVEAMADWLLALLGAAGVKRAMLAGHSMGSLIALEAAHRAPQQVSALALLGTTYPMTVSDTLLESARSEEGVAIDMVASWSHSSWLPGPSTAGPGNSVVNTARRLMQRMSARNPAQLFYTDFAACNAYANGEAAAASLACPVLFVLGSKDMMTPPRSTRLLTGAILHGKLVTVNAGHAMMAEAPEAVLDALLGFGAAMKSPAETATGGSR
jgi:pimeloyl-ACP methyl ester carboxylesterase